MQTNEDLVQEAAMLQYNIKNEFNYYPDIESVKLRLIQDANNRLGQIFSQLNYAYNSPKIEVGDTVRYCHCNYIVVLVNSTEVKLNFFGWADIDKCTLISKKIK